MSGENGVTVRDAYLQELDAQIERLTRLRALVASGGDTAAVESVGTGPLASRPLPEGRVHPGGGRLVLLAVPLPAGPCPLAGDLRLPLLGQPPSAFSAPLGASQPP